MKCGRKGVLVTDRSLEESGIRQIRRRNRAGHGADQGEKQDQAFGKKGV